jgi:glycosyltransferase involved in cell wall biosynthesis
MKGEITLAMMVKNEEKNLPRLLSSVEGVYDEFIAVDTGSKDATRRILESAGAKIIDSPWRRDFSYHRNEGLAAATKDWILMLDADEAVDSHSKHLIRKCVAEAKDTYHALWFVVRSFTANKNYSQATSIRMIRNGKGYRFENRVHNQLIMSSDVPTMLTPIVLWHWGYAISPEERIKKFQERLAILEQDLIEKPEDAAVWHHAAVNYRTSGMLEEAVAAARRAIKLSEENSRWRKEQFGWTRFIEAICLFLLERVSEAEKACLDGLEHHPNNIDFFFLLTRINYMRGDYDQAIKYGNAYLERQERFSKKATKEDNHFDSMGLAPQVQIFVQDSYMRLGGFAGEISRILNGTR